MGQQMYAAPPPPRQSSNWTCCLWGCLVSAILGVLIVVALGLGLRSCAIELRENYTAPAPVQLPSVDIDPDHLDAVTERVDAFSEDLEYDQPTAPLELTQDEINALIQHHPDWQFLRDKVYITIHDDVLTGEVSFPLDAIPTFGGRYFNGSVTLDLALEHGRLDLHVDSASVGGEPVPEYVLAILQSFAQEVRNDPALRETLSNVDRIEVRGEKLILIPRQAIHPAAAPEAVAPDEDVQVDTPDAPEPEPTSTDAPPAAL